MKKIFIDIGASQGQSVEYFHREYSHDYEIFSFEPDRTNIEAIKRKGIKTNLIEAAAWISTGVTRYYFGAAMGAGTLDSTKRTGGVAKDRFYMVKTINLAEFIKNNFTKDDYIIIKMNCEGSEYSLIPHLKHEGLIPWIDVWYVNWHINKIEIKKKEHEKIVDMIPKHKGWRPC